MFPSILSPTQHRLDRHYSMLNKCGLALALFLIVINEVWLRPLLSVEKEAFPRTLSVFARFLNSALTASEVVWVVGAGVVVALVIEVFRKLQPKWRLEGEKQPRRGFPKPDDLGTVTFTINNVFEAVVFRGWYFIMVPVIYFFAALMPCNVIGLIRSV